MGAPAARVYECAREWVKCGHDVTVLTGMPHHPTGIVPPEYQGRFFMRESVEGIDVCRAYVYATPNKGVYRRCWSYFTFMLFAVFSGLFRVKRPDVLVATSPQLLAGAAGWVVAAIRRVPFVFEVRDLWPESVEAVGAVKSRLLLAPLYALANFLYRRARHIVLVSDESREALIRRGVPASKMTVIKNGVDLDLFSPGARLNGVRERLGLGGEFVVMYIGTHGMAHGLEVVLRAAERLKEDPSVRFLLVGEGARKTALREAAAGLPNVTFVEGRPRAEVPEHIAASDACLVHLRAAELFKTVLPSKMFEIMACARPILLGVEGESRRTVEEAQAGLPFPPEDDQSLVEAVRRLRDDHGLGEEMSRNGRAFVERYYCRRALAKRYARLLETLA
jgi:glycosyltransferase involved in cell wall biosynthesis